VGATSSAYLSGLTMSKGLSFWPPARKGRSHPSLEVIWDELIKGKSCHRMQIRNFLLSSSSCPMSGLRRRKLQRFGHMSRTTDPAVRPQGGRTSPMSERVRADGLKGKKSPRRSRTTLKEQHCAPRKKKRDWGPPSKPSRAEYGGRRPVREGGLAGQNPGPKKAKS